MQVSMEIGYTVRLTAAEFRLVGLALSGRKLSKDEARDALTLNERLCQLRVAEMKVAAEVAQGAHQKATEALQALQTVEG